MRFAIVVEKANGNYSAYLPDLPGCVATGDTQTEVESLIREAIELHVAGLREDGLAVPSASSRVEYVDVTVEFPHAADPFRRASPAYTGR